MGFFVREARARAKLSLHLSDDGVVGEYFNQLIPTHRAPTHTSPIVCERPLFASSHTSRHQLLSVLHNEFIRVIPVFVRVQSPPTLHATKDETVTKHDGEVSALT